MVINGRGSSQVGREENQRGRGGRRNGNGYRGNAQPVKEVTRVDDTPKCYAFPGKTEVEASDAVITSTILVCD